MWWTDTISAYMKSALHYPMVLYFVVRTMINIYLFYISLISWHLLIIHNSWNVATIIHWTFILDSPNILTLTLQWSKLWHYIYFTQTSHFPRNMIINFIWRKVKNMRRIDIAILTKTILSLPFYLDCSLIQKWYWSLYL